MVVPKSRGRKTKPSSSGRAQAGTGPLPKPKTSVPVRALSGASVDLTAEISPGITTRVAGPDDAARFSELVGFAGLTETAEVAELLNIPEVAAAVMAGAEHGQEHFRMAMAKHMAAAPDLGTAALAASLPLVAVTEDGEIVGALLAFPPGNVIEQYVNAAPADSHQMIVVGAMTALVKLRALGIDPSWRGRGIGAGLVTRFKEIYLACGYFYLYGQFPSRKGFLRADTGLDSFYSQQGFTVLPKGNPLNLYVIFGIDGGIYPERGEQIFYYRRESD
jgi:GNAT superfamily N-acetyltransferase